MRGPINRSRENDGGWWWSRLCVGGERGEGSVISVRRLQQAIAVAAVLSFVSVVFLKGTGPALHALKDVLVHEQHRRRHHNSVFHSAATEATEAAGATEEGEEAAAGRGSGRGVGGGRRALTPPEQQRQQHNTRRTRNNSTGSTSTNTSGSSSSNSNSNSNRVNVNNNQSSSSRNDVCFSSSSSFFQTDPSTCFSVSRGLRDHPTQQQQQQRHQQHHQQQPYHDHHYDQQQQQQQPRPSSLSYSSSFHSSSSSSLSVPGGLEDDMASSFSSSEGEKTLHKDLRAAFLFISIYAVGGSLGFPAPLISVAGGAIFPDSLLLAVFLVLAGAAAGASLSYFLSRLLLQKILRQVIAGRWPSMLNLDVACNNNIQRRGFRIIFCLRLMAPYAVLNYSLGVTAASYSDFLLATVASGIPFALAYVAIGRELRDLEPRPAAVAVKLCTMAVGAGLWFLFGRWMYGVAAAVVTEEATRRQKEDECEQQQQQQQQQEQQHQQEQQQEQQQQKE